MSLTPGTVKLLMPPRRRRGVSYWTRACPFILGPCSLRRFFVRSAAKNAGIVVPLSRLFAAELAEKRREMRGSRI
jgi:hypothetical protein